MVVELLGKLSNCIRSGWAEEDGGGELGQHWDWGGGSGEALPLVWKKIVTNN